LVEDEERGFLILQKREGRQQDWTNLCRDWFFF
jgi:hypothetical protein